MDNIHPQEPQEPLFCIHVELPANQHFVRSWLAPCQIKQAVSVLMQLGSNKFVFAGANWLLCAEENSNVNWLRCIAGALELTVTRQHRVA